MPYREVEPTVSTQTAHDASAKVCAANAATVLCSDGEPQMGVDHWKHRSAGMRCMTCIWFVAKECNRLRDRDREVGRCRRHAPTMGGYPVVFGSDWCGDHRLDENK